MDKEFKMDIFGATQAYKMKVAIKKVYFRDGTEWEIPANQVEVWSGSRE